MQPLAWCKKKRLDHWMKEKVCTRELEVSVLSSATRNHWPGAYEGVFILSKPLHGPGDAFNSLWIAEDDQIQ